MKNLTLVILGAASLVALSGCDNVGGQLKVRKALVAVVDGQAATIPAGTYNATIEGSANIFKTQISLDLALKGGTGHILFNVPSGVAVPKEDGELKLTAAQSGQPFDMDGKIATNVQEGSVQSGVESCTRNETEQRCDGSSCHTETITITGQQDVQYHSEDTIRDVNVTISKAGAVLATFSGERDDSSKVYDYQGACY